MVRTLAMFFFVVVFLFSTTDALHAAVHEADIVIYGGTSSAIVAEKIPIVRNAWLNRETGVVKDGAAIKSITTLDGETYVGKMFIDVTYEGDLMAAAGVSYSVGREPQSKYDEKWNGVQTGVLH